MEIPQNHRELVDRLTASVQPVSRQRSPAVRMLAWMALPSALLIGTAASHRRPDLIGQLHAPAFALELALLAAGAGVSTWLAFRAAAPDRRASHRALVLAVAIIAAAVTALLAGPGGPRPVSAGFTAVGAGCLGKTVALAALPWLMLVMALRRGASVAPATAGALAGAAAFLLANVVMRLVCPIDAHSHVLTWHLLPAGIGTVLSAALGASRLGQWALSAAPPWNQRPA
jgi:hypothetical protein